MSNKQIIFLMCLTAVMLVAGAFALLAGVPAIPAMLFTMIISSVTWAVLDFMGAVDL